MAQKHSKFRNTGILFELLVRQTTADLVQNKDSKAVNIIKKYYVNTELGKEYSIYDSFIKYKSLNESKAELFISTIIETHKKLDYDKLQRLKYNLIKEIKSNYDIDNFFKAKVDNYKAYASLYVVLESQYSKSANISQVLSSKINMLEHICGSAVKEKPASVAIIEEFMQQDKEIRLLAYKILIEKFNKKYGNLSQDQKAILKEYINNVSDTKNLKLYLNEKIESVKKQLTELSKSINDTVTNIKIKAVTKLIKPIKENENIKDEVISTLLQYYDLINEIKKAKEK
jgi:hypothetical protein